MKISKNFLLLGLFTIALVSTIISCKKDDDSEDLIGNWIEKPFDYIGNARSEAVSFTIGIDGYVGCGYDGDNYLKDFYAYNSSSGQWRVITTPPAEFIARINAVAFTANGKGYVGLGMNIDQQLGDFWSYDPGTNSWSLVDADNGPSARYGAVAFGIGNIGYVGTGFNTNALLDFYAYNATTNTWSQIANYSTKVKEAAAFVLNGKGYVVSGEKNGVVIDDFCMYDPESDSWVAKRRVSNVSTEGYDDKYTIIRKQAVAFTINDKAYITTGNNGTLKKDTWEYDAVSDVWSEKTSFEGAARNNAVAFSTSDGRAYVVTGNSGSSGYFDNLFEFKPNDDFNEDD